MIDESIYLVDSFVFSEMQLKYYEKSLGFKPIGAIFPYLLANLFQAKYLVLHVLTFIVDLISAILIFKISELLFKDSRFESLLLNFAISITFLYLSSKAIPLGVNSAQIAHFSNLYLIIFAYAILKEKQSLAWYIFSLSALILTTQVYLLLVLLIFIPGFFPISKFKKIVVFISVTVLFLFQLSVPNAFNNLILFAGDYQLYQDEKQDFFRKIRNFLHFPFTNISYFLTFFIAHSFFFSIKNFYYAIKLNFFHRKIFILVISFYIPIFATSVWQQHRLMFDPVVSFSIFFLIYYYGKNFYEIKSLLVGYLILIFALSINSTIQSSILSKSHSYWQTEYGLNQETITKLFKKVEELNLENGFVIGKLLPDVFTNTRIKPSAINPYSDFQYLIIKDVSLQTRILESLQSQEIDLLILFKEKDKYFTHLMQDEFYKHLRKNYKYLDQVHNFRLYIKK